MSKKEALWDKQNKAIRHPSEVFGVSYEQAGIDNSSLKYKASPAFVKLLNQLGVTLIISREYENMLIALSGTGTNIKQSFFHLPHPSGLVADRKKGLLYVAATRNPNQIVEFRISGKAIKRKKIKAPASGYLLPARSKYFPGQYYFHDLALIGDALYANSVGMNSVLKVDLNSTKVDEAIWWPKCIEKSGKPDFTANYIQLNSIAAGKNLNSSFFSASAAKISNRLPGQLNFPVDKRGVIFSGKSRLSEFSGLTRPHSARLHKGKLWIANSGYGEVGYFKGKEYVRFFDCKGWTRGLCFIDNVLFVGVSRVLPRFRQYAPGIKAKAKTCAVLAIDLSTGKKIGEVVFPAGNQIFAIDYFSSTKCKGFPFLGTKKQALDSDIFSVSL